jgi:hypothetical protein
MVPTKLDVELARIDLESARSFDEAKDEKCSTDGNCWKLARLTIDFWG